MSPPLRTITVGRPFLPTNCTLGEGPLYDRERSTLHFVDIEQCKVYHLDINTLKLTCEQFEEPVTSLALRKNGGLACTTSKGFAIIEADSTLKYLAQPIPSEHAPYTRFNDGACDRRGRYIAGTLCDKRCDVPGQLYMYDPADQSCKVVDKGPFTDSNGLGWSADEKTMYFTDSLVNKIYAYDYDDGKLSGRRVFVNPIAHGLPEGTFPDGLCIDNAGGIWSARWGGSRIIRYTPDGEMDLEVIFPTALNITACCFGGPNEDRLFVTTAHCGACGGDASRQVRYPDSGNLFVVDLTGQFTGGRWRYHFAA
ncbi:regucalcin [Wolfiporia cocos MD-104 SS10]|uniref:Regucalcin n=1 Tax=Wolfiporia cocos (strain MD-104) TaxID=742152 RepID=A0A2H3JCU7_WOLCO|nr:regucalcin [Wolfiporia cocos MD-104 SS10]